MSGQWAATLPDLCVSCSSAVKTFANLQIVRDEKHLVPTWMPPGGCTCASTSIDPECPRCFPSALRCRDCGEGGSWVCGRCGKSPESHATNECVHDPIFRPVAPR